VAVVLYGIGSPLIVDIEESCARLELPILAAVKNIEGPVYSISGAPIYTAEALPERLRGLPFNVPIFTPGHRRLAVAEAERRGFGRGLTIIDPHAIVARSTEIDAGTFINCGVVVGGAGTVGRFVLVNRSASIGHHAAIADYVSIGPAATLAGNVSVGRGAVVGTGAIIGPGVTIGENAVVAMGSVVNGDVAAHCMVGGRPARVLKTDIAGYNECAA
jgi:sugar O-acyltransferase (sialic acid O-acetyltransferase NeuD family)